MIFNVSDEKSHSSGIYVIRNTINNECYIGSTIDLLRRFKQHEGYLNMGIHKTPKLQKAWSKYGSNNFIFELIEIIKGTKAELLERENFYLNEIKPQYNTFLTSTWGYNDVAEKTRKKMSDNRKGKKKTEEHKRKIGESRARTAINKRLKSIDQIVGYKSEKARQTGIKRLEYLKSSGFDYCVDFFILEVKCSLPLAERKKRPPLTKQQRHELSQSLRGRKVSEETKAKISAKNSGQKRTEETRRKMSEAQKKRFNNVR